ncbi:hypothetical protein BDP27DRAFT_1446213 [Rhodocollybia butyracea]|uniref:F-box domain-containing protein n=1 Tax=Rhodocollybia butyracea TaxID=206335 RepID=A0A9P5UA79_9AGAR|nr:hypothetical protein BDP27DRAFT_1446213 [Rhodocollybia butyracea]
MNVASGSNLGNSLTLKRRRGLRNLKRSDDTDSIHELAGKRFSPHRPSSSGASYVGTSSSSHLIMPLSDSEDEPFARTENNGRTQVQPEVVEPQDASKVSRELTRSMTADIFSSTRPSIHDWEGRADDIESASDTLSEGSPLEIHTHDLPTAFINQLPNELLTLIFSYGSQLPHFELRYPLTPVPPFKTPSLIETVICVCQRWRQLAIHTPSLWTSVLVTRSRSDLDRLPSVADFQKPMNSISHALQRTLNLPLDITLDCTHISSKTAIRQLAAERHRWRSLSIIVPTTGNLPSVLANLKDIEAPFLECLEITANKFHDGDLSSATPLAFLKSSPRLSTVRLNRVGIRWSASPLQALSTLELRFILWPSHTDFQNLFANSPGLQNLKLHFDTHAFARLDRNNGSPTVIRPLIKIPCLRTLELRFIYHDNSSTHNVIPLLQLFSLPALEELTLKDFGTAEWCRSLVYFRCYARSFPKLTRLILDRVKDIIYVDSSLVRAFPRLTSLRLIGVYSSAFCRLLSGARTQDLGQDGLPPSPLYEVDVWPRLQELVIEQDSEGKIDLVASAVRSRRQMGRSLRRVQLDRAFFDKAEQEDKREVVTWLKGVTDLRYL